MHLPAYERNVVLPFTWEPSSVINLDESPSGFLIYSFYTCSVAGAGEYGWRKKCTWSYIRLEFAISFFWQVSRCKMRLWGLGGGFILRTATNEQEFAKKRQDYQLRF